MSDWLDLNLLADGQLEGAELAAAQSRLASDPAAQAEYQAILKLKDALKSSCNPIPNQDSWQEGLRRLDAIDRVRPVERVVAKYSWALCGVVAVALVGAHFNARSQGNAFNPAMAQAGVSTGPAQKAEDISDVLAREGVTLPPITRRGLHPTNFARFLVDGQPCTRIWLSDDRGGLILDIYPGVTNLEGQSIRGSESKRVQLNSMNGVGWVGKENAYVLVGDRAESDLLHLSNKLNLR